MATTEEIKDILNKVTKELGEIKEKLNTNPCASSNQNSLPGGSSNPILLSSVQSCSTSDKTYSGPSTTPKQEVEKQMNSIFPSLAGKNTSKKFKGSSLNAIKNPFLKDTFTREFCCVPFCFSRTTPNVSLYRSLERAGLGKKKITFHQADKHSTVIDKITKAYPRLKDTGSFTLHRSASGGSNRPLAQLDINYFDVDKIRSVCKGKAVIYIKPLQRDLSLHEANNSEMSECDNVRNATGASTICLDCEALIPINRFESHQLECRNRKRKFKEDDGDTSENDSVDNFDAILTKSLFDKKIEKVDDKDNDNDAMKSDDMRVAVEQSSGGSMKDQIEKEEFQQPQSLGELAKDEQDILQLPQSSGETDEVEKLITVQTTHSSVEKDPFMIFIEKNKDLTNPVELLRLFQLQFVKGRPLEVERETEILEGETSYITVDRFLLLETGLKEMEDIENISLTLEVQFFGEAAYDNGGPRKEFFRLMLIEIVEKYFNKDGLLREDLMKDYFYIGRLMALSILQNGPIPRFLTEVQLNEVFFNPNPNLCMNEIRKSFEEFGIYQITKAFPLFIHLFRPNPLAKLTMKRLISVMNPQFSEDGTNMRKFEGEMFALLCKYFREVAAGRRNGISLNSVLCFFTGAEDEPILGFKLKPCLKFVKAKDKEHFSPTANTCINQMQLPIPTLEIAAPTSEKLFVSYDYAFSNTYFGFE